MNSQYLNETGNENPVLVASGNETDEKKSNYPRWAELPDFAVENIYSFLNRRDQRNMSLVCHNWRKEYSAPSLWRRVKFVFPDVESGAEVCPEVVSARRFGSMFRHLEIVYKMERPPFLPLPPVTVLKQLAYFMEAVMCRSQLISLSFHIFVYMKLIDDDLYADFYQAMINLIKSQKKLQHVDFISCCFENAETAEIVKTIFANNSNTLRYVHLPNYDPSEANGEFDDIAADAGLNFQLLMNLEKLNIENTQIVEKILLSFYDYSGSVDVKHRKGRLKTIQLFCDWLREDSYLRIQPSTWDYLIRFFPDLSIHLKLISPCDTISLSTAIIPRMPIKVLEFTSEHDLSPGKEAGTLLRHITSCGINKSLEVFVVTWLPREGPNFAPDLMNFTSVCLKLKRLELELNYPILALDTVFKNWLENRPPSLEFVKLTMRRHSAEERAIFKNLHDLYAPLLQSVAIQLLIYLEETVHV